MMPRVVPSDHPEVPSLVEAALETGQTIIFPTDTVYGVGGNPWDERVLDRVHSLKGRPSDRPFTLHLPSAQQVARYARLDGRTQAAVERLLPGPYTLLLPASAAAPPAAVSDGILGVRVPDHPFFLAILAALRRPLFGTSVNVSGERPLSEINEIIDRFSSVDLIFVGPVGTAASTILDLTVDPARVVRGVRPEGL